jgi:mannosylglycerate hydrolase
MANRTVAIVPHTHWDREWYSPFQDFRMRLVKLLDTLLPILESDLSYARFLLDGQTIVLDDYLEIRPEAAAALTRLAASGRLAVGPWMVLMDEFMVSGETLVRDLQLGMARGAQFGGAMQVGYLPDMFGHVAQMPQLLRLAGLEHAVVWRGVPLAITQTAFWWEAPDGSRVRAEYLYGSYSNGRDMPDDAKRLVGRARDYEAELGSVRIGDLLLMNGTDHQMPQPWLGRVVAEANQMQDEYEFVVTSLPEYLPTQPVDGLATWRGELRSGARANVLMGVASNRVDVHRVCAAAERSVEKRAEPLSALFRAPAAYPHALLGLAWRLLVANSAHDSSCACSSDEVVDQVAVRYAEARQLGDGLARDATNDLAASVDAPAGATLVVNPTSHARGGLLEISMPGHGPAHIVTDDGRELPAQVLAERGGLAFSDIIIGSKVRWVLDLMRGVEFAGNNVAETSIERADDGVWDVGLHLASPGQALTDLGDLREEMLRLGDAGDTLRIKAYRPASRRLLFDAGPVAAFGWTTAHAVEGEVPDRPDHSRTSASGTTLHNEHLDVEIDPASGTYAVTTRDGVTVASLGRLVDGGDGGDTYNYSPPAVDVEVSEPDSVAVTVFETGPVRAMIAIDTTYTWPRNAAGNERSCTTRSDERVPVAVRTTLELRPGERFLRVRTQLDNQCDDHRLRAHFPLPAPVRGSDAECAFAVVQRGLTAEGGELEFGLPTFVSRRFVDASDGAVGLALLHDGLLEYEVVGEGTELALTLLRAVGFLSRSEPSLRPNPAGPLLPVRGAQMRGPNVCDYAVLPHRGDWRAADLYAEADTFLVPLERGRVSATSARSLPATGTALEIDGAEVSAVARDAGGLVVRLFRTAPGTGEATVTQAGLPARGWIIDLRGAPLAAFDGSVTMRPWEIVSLRLSS